MKIINPIKRLIINLVHRLGYQIKSTKKNVQNNDFDSIISFLLRNKSLDKHIYFDVGANLGQSIKRFKKINNLSTIYSFEPTPHLFESLEKNFGLDKKVFLNKIAISDRGGEKIDFYSYKYHKINSPYPTDKKSKFSKSRMFASQSNEKEFEEIISVETESIDSFCKKKNIEYIDYIKIDTQGYEEKVLTGMNNFLKKNNVSIIELELILGFGYQKDFSFYDYEKIFNQENYRLIAIDTPGNVISTSNYQTNILYVKNEIFETIRQIHEKNIGIDGITNKTDRSHPFSY
tara:strand:+ start:4711 stop:5577 length:867 start_codon:yes stop_codon:yes gene_type:complete